MILDETFDKKKCYFSPTNDKVAIYINGKWQIFYSEQAVMEINNLALENFKKNSFASATDAILKLYSALTLEEVNNPHSVNEQLKK